ncbi:MAG: CinA family protein, partial [Oscillospiraceae bacterium]
MDSYEKILSEIGQLANRAVTVCRENGYKLATAESCTGGMISAAITAVSGSSAVIELGVCSYSNRIKHDILGVSTAVLEAHTEYSLQCAEE